MINAGARWSVLCISLLIEPVLPTQPGTASYRIDYVINKAHGTIKTINKVSIFVNYYPGGRKFTNIEAILTLQRVTQTVFDKIDFI